MRRVRLMLGVGLTASFLTVAAGRAADTGLIGGVIVDAANNSPVPGATVTLTAAGQSPFQAGNRVLTDANGRYYFSGLGAGEFTLTASKPGWLEGAYGRHRAGGAAVPLPVSDAERRGGVTIEMWKAAVIAGRVADEAGDPLVGAAVRIYQQQFAAGRRQFTFRARAITDDRGAYRFFDLVPGDYIVVVPGTVTSEPGAFRLQTETPRAYLQTMTAIGAAPISMEPATAVTGSNRPLLYAALGMPQAPSSSGAWTTYPTTLFPSTANLDSATAVRAVAGRERAGVDVVVRMTPTFQVSGQLASADATPAGFHAVHLLPADSADHPLFDVATAVTDSSGAFTFYGVPPGQYVARVVKAPWPGGQGRFGQCGGTGAIKFICSISDGPGGIPEPPSDPLLFAEQRVTVTDDHVRNVAMTLRAGGRVGGRAEFEGSTSRPADVKMDSVSVSLERADGQTAQPAGGFDITIPGRFAADDTFTTASTAPGRYLVRVNPPKGWALKSAVFEGRDVSESPFSLDGDASGVVVTFTNRPGKVEGTVTGTDGQGDDRAMVLLFPTDSTKWVDYGRSSRRVRSAATAGGKYSMPGPPDGEYFLIAIQADLATDWQDPAFLERISAQADRVSMLDGQTLTHALQTRRIQ